MKKLIYILLFICLALPASAWEQSFEGHPNDADIDNFVSEDFTLITTDHNIIMGDYCDSTKRRLYIYENFDGYFGFDISADNSRPFDVTFTLKNNTDIVIFYGDVLPGMTIGDGSGGMDRIELIVNPSETGLDVYRNGNYVNSFPFTPSTAAGYDREGSMSIQIKAISGSLNVGFDNMCSEAAMIGMDESASYLENYQYYNVGLANPAEAYWFTKLYDPQNTLISTQTVTRGNIYSINLEDFIYSGKYKLRLFQHDNITNSNYFYSERSFDFDTPSRYLIRLDKDIYTPGEQMEIFTMMPSYSSGHKVSISYKTASGYKCYTYDVTSDDQTKTWTIPSDAQGGSFFAYFRDPSDNVVAYDPFEIIAPFGTMSLTLDKSIYEKNDDIRITYKYLPEDSDITLILRSGTTNLYTESWRDLSGSGVITFNINGFAADSVQVQAIRPVPRGTDIVLKEVTAEILCGEGFVSGKVYDSITATPIPGATISIGGSQTTTDALGYYEITCALGTQPVTITKDGYEQYTGSMQVYSFAFSKVFYIVPTVSTGQNTLYGTVEDYYTGDPLTGTYIQIKNGSTVYTMLTHSRSGNYLFDQEGLEGTWTMTVSKKGYDTHTRTVLIDGDTHQSIKLVPVGGSPKIPNHTDDSGSDSGGSDSGGSDSGGSGSSVPGSSDTPTTDRPGRQAAKDSMAELEKTIPGLIGFVVLVVFMQLIKEM